MFLEIERRFLVREDYVPSDPSGGVRMRAAYLLAGRGLTIRVRIENDLARVTFKQRNSALERAEFEYPVPPEDAEYMMNHFPLSGSIVEKTRYREIVDGREWAVDLFSGDNAPLRIAEIELPAADTAFRIPEWALEEITGDDAYSNAALALKPYRFRT